MESWQKQHITKNRVHLVETVTCNELIFSHLLSEGVLANVDVERIKRTGDRYEQAAVLLDIVETRQNGFVGMTKALAKVNQTGPYSVFMEGFARNVIPEMKVDFLGRTLHLTELFDSAELERVIQKIKSHLTLDEYISLYDKSKNQKSINLLRGTIPEEISFYVPRSLSKRVKVNPELFKMKMCNDVFVFKGIGCSQLAKLVEPHRVSFSSTQLLSLSTRFIVLEHADDWEDICKIAKVCVHLIKYEEEDGIGYVLEATTGGSTVVHQFLKRQKTTDDQNENVSISEDEFFQEVSKGGASGVCICDLPGMGKSLLLANLARKMKQEHPQKVVVFVQLSHFMAFVAGEGQKQTTSALNVSLAKKMLHEYVTPAQLEHLLLAELLNKGGTQLELFLDGFDEVQMAQVAIAKKLLALLASLPNTRLFVTSRPNMRHELEASLHVLSYDILSFSHTNQVDFLTAFWSSLRPRNSRDKLRAFAQFCIAELKANLHGDEEEITGIPLQCRLVAEVFSLAANIFARSERNVPAQQLCKVESSLPDLYKRYCVLSFNKTAARVGDANYSKFGLFYAAQEATRLMEAVVGGRMCLSRIQEVKDFHTMQAVNLIFPDASEMLSQLFGSGASSSEYSDMLSVGVLRRELSEGHESFHFVHRTFAEYLAAEFFANLLYDDMADKELHAQLVRFLLEQVMKTKRAFAKSFVFVHSVVIHFLNSACAETMINSNEICCNTFASYCTPYQLFQLLCSIIRESHVNLLLLLSQLLSKMTPGRLQSFKSECINPNLLNFVCTAAEYSNAFFVEKLFELFRECFAIDLNGRDKQRLMVTSTYDNNPLRSAVKSLDFEMVQFFADKVRLDVHHLIKDCVAYSLSQTAIRIAKTLTILEYLLVDNGSLVVEMPDVLIQVWHVHVDVIKFLLSHGVNPRDSRFGETVVHRAARDMPGESFGELCRHLIEDHGAEDLFVETDGKWTSPLPIILANTGISENVIRTIYDFSSLDANDIVNVGEPRGRIKVDINYSNEDGCTLLMIACKANRSIKILESMIKMGVATDAKDREGRKFHNFTGGYTRKERDSLLNFAYKNKRTNNSH